MNTKLKIRLETLTDIRKFVDAVTSTEGNSVLENEAGTYRINAKSFLGAAAAVEDWGDIWVCSDNANIYSAIKEFVI